MHSSEFSGPKPSLFFPAPPDKNLAARTCPPRRLSHSRAATSPPLIRAPSRPDGPRSGHPGPFLRRPRPAPSSPERRPRPKQRRHAPSRVPRRPAAVVAVTYLRRPPAPASFPASLTPRRPDPAAVRLLSVLVLLRPATSTTNPGHLVHRRTGNPAKLRPTSIRVLSGSGSEIPFGLTFARKP